MSKPGCYLIVYDITNNKERAGVSKVLSGYGQRVQESVFECRLSAGMREKLCRTLEGLEIKTGFILIYHLHNQAKRRAVGQVPAEVKNRKEHAFVV